MRLWRTLAILVACIALVSQALAQDRPQRRSTVKRKARPATRPAPGQGAEPAEESEEPKTEIEVKVKEEPAEAFDIDREIAEKPFIYIPGVGRDPFKTPLTLKQPEVESPAGKPPRVKPPAVVEGPTDMESQRRLVTEIGALSGQIEALLAKTPVNEKRIVALDDEMAKKIAQAQRTVSNPVLRRKLLNSVKVRDSIGPRLAAIKLRYLGNDIAERLGVVERTFAVEKYEQTIQLSKDLVDIAEKNRELLAADPDISAKVLADLAKAATLGRKAEIRIEFGQKEIVVTGINWSPDKSFAVINGDIDATVGAAIEGATVTRIDESGVVLDYKGELFEKPFFD